MSRSGVPRRRPAGIVALVLGTIVSATVASGCRGGSTPAAVPSSPFDQVAPVPTSTQVPGAAPTIPATEGAGVASPTTAQTLRGLETPEAASQNLWDSWRDDDRRRALLYADAAAVDSLFEVRWRPDARNEGCGFVDGGFRCVYLFTERRSVVARVVLISGNPDIGFRAARIQSIGELPTSNRLDGAIVDATPPSDTTGTDGALVSPDPTEPLVPVDAAAAAAAGPTSTGPGSEASNAVGAGNSAPTVPPLASSTTIAGRVRRASRSTRATRSSKRTRAASVSVATDPGAGAPAPAPAPQEPAPEPSPAPARPAAPVQAGGRTVDTVAPG